MEMMNKQKYAESFGRMIEDNEIVFDADDREKGFEAINFIAINLFNEGYKFEVWFAEGQKSPHLHIRNIIYLELEGKQLSNYKELIIKKYTPQEYLGFVDVQVCGKHRIAEENKPHYKYSTIKKLLSVFNENKLNYAEQDLIFEAKKDIIPKQERVVNINGSGIMSKIAEKISIIDYARECGIKVRGKMALCPFHADKNPSLSFDDSRGLFNCFGCSAQGNIVDFIYLLRKNKIGAVKNG